MRLKLTLLFLLAFFNVAMSQIFPEKQPTVYAAEVFKQDQSKSAFGILWAAEEDKLMILPKKQYRKWKKSKLESPELTFTEINPDNLLYLKVFNAKKPRYAVSYGIFAGLGIGMITGFIRKGQYEKDFCEQAEDPLWIRCIPEDQRVRNNMIFGGITGAIAGLIFQPIKLKIDLKYGNKSYNAQRKAIKEFTILP